MLAYYGTQISPNQIETAEGFLICRNVPIARTGRMEYLARELQLDGAPERIVLVNRRPEDVFEAAALASFEGKPVTDGHPPENVGPENYAAYLKGHVQNVRRDGEYMVADLYINDAVLASQVQGGMKREVSCGYLCDYAPDGDGYRQSHIRGNHVAVVLRGRAGHEVAIKDAAQRAEKGRNNMSDFWKNVLTAFGMAAKDASPEELTAMVETAGAALDAAPEKKEEPPAQEKEAPPTGDAKCGDEMVEKAPKGDDLGSKLDKVIEMLSSLQHKNDREEKQLNDEAALDAMIEQLGGGQRDEAAVIPADDSANMAAGANDAALELLRRMRPAVASIKDKFERARVVDALLDTLKGREVMDGINQAAQNGAKKAADAARATDYEKMCAEQQAEYYARNPHKKEG